MIHPSRTAFTLVAAAGLAGAFWLALGAARSARAQTAATKTTVTCSITKVTVLGSGDVRAYGTACTGDAFGPTRVFVVPAASPALQQFTTVATAAMTSGKTLTAGGSCAARVLTVGSTGSAASFSIGPSAPPPGIGVSDPWEVAEH